MGGGAAAPVSPPEVRSALRLGAGNGHDVLPEARRHSFGGKLDLEREMTFLVHTRLGLEKRFTHAERGGGGSECLIFFNLLRKAPGAGFRLLTSFSLILVNCMC